VPAMFAATPSIADGCRFPICVVLLGFIFFVTGCASWLPPITRELEPGQYEISTSGGSFTSVESMAAKIDRKARKLCGAENYHYQTKNGRFQSAKTPTYVNGRWTDVYSFSLTRVVTCGRE